ncbi:MAG: DEAD/DEAH box helicase, partial [Nitrososphaerota archaeon]|nr:DEAD/DEAH box helicase [Nitrososphaerota archaeon]
MEARDYQVRLASEVGDGNAIIVLPTGLGKTAIAALILAATLQRRGGRALFLAPTRVLVQQHRAFLEKVVDLPAGSVASLTGEDDVLSRSDAWACRVVCATPQIAVQDYRRRLYEPSRFSIV